MDLRLKTVKPETLGLSSERLARAEAFLKDRYIDKGRLKGLSLALMRRGEVAWTYVAGFADAERGQALTEDSLFRIYSMTKPITSVALMMLVEEGKIALDDPVSRFIPSWNNLKVYQSGTHGAFVSRPLEKPMRILDLMRHTSGLTYGFQKRTAVDEAYRLSGIGDLDHGVNLETMVEILSDLPLEFSPGTAWNYSVATDIIGYILQKVSGKPLDQLLKERLFDPLGMTDTGFYLKSDQISRFTACYARGTGGVVLSDDPMTSPYLAPPKLMSGGGGLISSLGDYLEFCKMVLGRGRYKDRVYIAPKTLDLMSANHLPDGGDLTGNSVSLFSEGAYAGTGFGLGFATTIDPVRTLIPASKGDLWWGGMASTFFFVDPLEDMSLVLMTQLIPSAAYPIRREIRTLVYSALIEPNG